MSNEACRKRKTENQGTYIAVGGTPWNQTRRTDLSTGAKDMCEAAGTTKVPLAATSSLLGGTAAKPPPPQEDRVLLFQDKYATGSEDLG